MNEVSRHAFIYYVHYVSNAVKAEIEKVVDSLPSDFSSFAVGCCADQSTLEALGNDRTTAYSYIREDLRSLPYAAQLARVDWKTMRYSADLAIMKFFREHPNFDYYWIVEYDVRFVGKWNSLIVDLAMSKADLISSFFTSYRHSPDWMHWDSFRSGNDIIERESLCRSFFPVARMSNRLMTSIDERCMRGWAGQYEVLWTTVAKTIDATIEEIGGIGSVVPQERRGKYYEYMMTKSGLFLSTFGAWPSYSNTSSFATNSPENMLWHPVKE